MTTTKLCELALTHRSPDLNDWPDEDVRTAVVELLETDEAKHCPDWLTDCLVEAVGCVENKRQQTIAALKLASPVASEAVIGKIIRDALLEYPRDSLTHVAEQNYAGWLAEERASEAERMADSARETVDTAEEGQFRRDHRGKQHEARHHHEAFYRRRAVRD